MRILMVSNLWPPQVVGGAEQYASALAEHLRRDGHEVDALTLGVEGPDVAGIVEPWPYPIQETPLQPARRRLLFHAVDVYNPRAGRTIDTVLDQLAPDVVHTHAVQGLSSVALDAPGPARGRARPHAARLLAAVPAQLDGPPRRARLRDPVPIVCRHLLDPQRVRPQVAARRRARGLAGDRRRARAPPVDRAADAGALQPGRSGGRTRTSPRGDGRPLTFGFLGRLGVDKGVLTLLDAFARADLPDARLVFAGRGPLEPAVRDAGPGVISAGWVDRERKEALLDDLDCLVVPSQWKDPAPVVVNEARGRGIPVIGAEIGGIPELLAPECRELLFPAGDTGALAARLATFAATPQRYRPVPAAAPTDWAGHLAAVMTAYADARDVIANAHPATQ